MLFQFQKKWTDSQRKKLISLNFETFQTFAANGDIRLFRHGNGIEVSIKDRSFGTFKTLSLALSEVKQYRCI